MARGARKKSQSITIETVARLAGVSAMTVSNVLNNAKPVREATREAVLRAVAELNYTPNLAAKSLASADTTRVGLLISRDEYSFISSVLGGAVEATTATGAQLLLHRLEMQTPAVILAAIDGLVASGAHAIVLPGLYAGLVLPALQSGHVPVPVVAASPGKILDGVTSVRIDDEEAAREMTAYLIGLGHRRIGFLRAIPTHLINHSRHAGFIRAMSDAGLPVDPSLVITSALSFDGGMETAAAFLDRPDRPTAIFASNDDTASAIVAMAHKRGIRVPEDLSVAGFDDSPLTKRMWPRLTTVHQPVTEIARRATELAVSLARGAESTAAERGLCIGHEIIARETTAPPALH